MPRRSEQPLALATVAIDAAIILPCLLAKLARGLAGFESSVSDWAKLFRTHHNRRRVHKIEDNRLGAQVQIYVPRNNHLCGAVQCARQC
jgi:hypothetical protein